MLIFLFLTALILAQHTIHILLMDKQLAHLIAGGAVRGIRRLFFCQQLGVFVLQAPDRGQLFHAKLVKGFLRRSVQQDVAFMLCKILFGIARFSAADGNIIANFYAFLMPKTLPHQSRSMPYFDKYMFFESALNALNPSKTATLRLTSRGHMDFN